MGSHKVVVNGREISIRDDWQKYVLPLQTAAEAAEEALKVVEDEREDEQLGLYCRWPAINRAMLKYWRFNNVTAIGGMPGSGKSYILNMLLQDFTDPVLNAGFKGKVICLHGGYEMDPADELLRTVSGQLKTSYSYLLSSEYNTKTEKYNKITNGEIENIKKNLDGLGNRPIYYVKTAGSVPQLYYTAYDLMNKFPDHKLVVSNDHTLLNMPTSVDRNDNDLIATAAKWFIKMRKDFKCITIPLVQLNGNIQQTERLRNPSLHFPIYTDIHGSNQMYMATDNTIVFHRPTLLHLSTYGDKDETGKVINKTEHLIHAAVLKSRKGKTGNVWLKEDLAHGQILQAKREDFITEDIPLHF